jgi:hypothetical protein
MKRALLILASLPLVFAAGYVLAQRRAAATMPRNITAPAIAPGSVAVDGNPTFYLRAYDHGVFTFVSSGFIVKAKCDPKTHVPFGPASCGSLASRVGTTFSINSTPIFISDLSAWDGTLMFGAPFTDPSKAVTGNLDVISKDPQ